MHPFFPALLYVLNFHLIEPFGHSEIKFGHVQVQESIGAKLPLKATRLVCLYQVQLELKDGSRASATYVDLPLECETLQILLFSPP
jgi:hypothetical protein